MGGRFSKAANWLLDLPERLFFALFMVICRLVAIAFFGGLFLAIVGGAFLLHWILGVLALLFIAPFLLAFVWVLWSPPGWRREWLQRGGHADEA